VAELLTLSHETVRDVELRLVEELKCNEAFVRWFERRIGLEETDPSKTEIIHSHSRARNRRQIDIGFIVGNKRQYVELC